MTITPHTPCRITANTCTQGAADTVVLFASRPTHGLHPDPSINKVAPQRVLYPTTGFSSRPFFTPRLCCRPSDHDHCGYTYPTTSQRTHAPDKGPTALSSTSERSSDLPNLGRRNNSRGGICVFDSTS
ncbi:hypothetical protein M413DRAFT_285247 [Hebeloma cylindrosporum]|uniref:Uncharacterized protein n=1 Tax=Hebeloma cylindrosporum TaxID=76867 RepID=A0A0C3BJD0_HEBCY|nr:hypothetical protein M413DRAFT_285247 [Hebeloma cylindrosporum h7]